MIVLEQDKKRLLVLIFLSLVYLSFEFSFNSTILDASSTIFDIDSLESIENFGKLLSGTAIALVISPIVYEYTLDIKKTMITFFVVVFVVFFLIKGFIHHIVVSHDAEFRKNALSISLFKEAVLTNKISLPEINDVSELDKKAFFTVFPFMLMNTTNTKEIIENAKLKLITDKVKQEYPIDKMFSNYQKAILETSNKYKEYAKVEKPNINLEQFIQEKQTTGWLDYTTELAAKGLTISTVPPRYYDKVRKNVMKKAGISLPEGWKPNDQETFNQAVKNKIIRDYKIKTQPYENGLTYKSPTGKTQQIPFGYSWDKFFNLPVIQETIIDTLKFSVVKKVNVDYKTEEEFKSLIYDKEINYLIQQQLKVFDSPLESYETNGSNYRKSITAVETILVPPIALFLSFLGLLLHLNKMIYLTTKLFNLHYLKIFLLILTFNTVAFFSVFINTKEGNITENKLFSYLSQENGEYMKALKVIVLGQTFLYTPSEFIRNNLLFGLHFGYKKD